MRKAPAPRYLTVQLEDNEWWEGCSLKILTNPPIGSFQLLDQSNPSSILQFIDLIVVDWDGFDVPFSTEELHKLTTDELAAFMPAIQQGIGNPQKPTSAGL
jgi:hypothetical protein